MNIKVYKVETTEWVTRIYKDFDRINSCNVTYWDARIDNGEPLGLGASTRKEALRAAEKIVKRTEARKIANR